MWSILWLSTSILIFTGLIIIDIQILLTRTHSMNLDILFKLIKKGEMMSKFLQCEIFTFLKILILLIVVYLIVKIVGNDIYTKSILIGGLFLIGVYGVLFIWKLVKLIFSNDNTDYQCSQGETFRRAMTWISNIV